jgi:hypothetical protein
VGQLGTAVDEIVVAGKLIDSGQAQIVMGAKGFVCSRKIAGGSPSFNGSRSKVIVVRVMGVCSRKVAGIHATWCSSRR